MMAGLTVAFLGLLQCALVIFDSRQAAVLFTGLFVAAETFVTWNRAFIRADDHVLSFFSLQPAVLATIWVVAQPKKTIRLIGYAINLLALVICIVGVSQQRPLHLSGSLATVRERVVSSWQATADLRAYSSQLRTLRSQAETNFALPRIRAEVRDATVDVLGIEQAIALLNRFNYTPRPVFQGYTAYTDRLISLNTAFYSSPKAPAYVLFKQQTIDDRYPTLDDAGVLKELLCNYKPLLEEKGYFLWKRIDPPARPVQGISTVNASLTFGSEQVIPAGQALWLQLDFQPSFAGRLLNLFYKSPQVTIRLTNNSESEINDRLIPSMTSSGFILCPNLRTSWHLLRAASGISTMLGGSFSIHVPSKERWFFQPTITCRMTTFPAMPKSDLEEEARKMSETAIIEFQQNSQRDLPQPSNASKEVLLNLDPQNKFEGISPLNQTQVSSDGAGLRIESSQSNSYLLLPLFPRGSKGGMMLRIEFIVSVDTDVTLSFLPVEVADYGSHALRRYLYRGKNNVYFFLTDSQIAGGRIRLDCPMSPVPYVITHVEARAVSPEAVSDR